ncbi:phosphatidate cytidylyltransferase [Piscinibacter sakaiensis]|uniref:phosphatidate cytidylyltransferase n=1 Tax=Piscinibacter sakaiensis TaxID=1547922 RepID=UPI003AAD499A
MNVLRALDVGQQVALLFLFVFGLLVLATVFAYVWSSRATASLQQQERLTRDLRTLWIGSIVFWLAWISGPVGATLLFGVISFLALREIITLAPTRRGDHRSLILAFFVVLPLQYVLVANRSSEIFSVFIPVYVFFAIPVISALAGDPHRFLERNAKIQWAIMVCVFGLSHAPALLLLEFEGFEGRGAFLLFFLVVVVTAAQIAQQLASRWLRRRPVARRIDRWFSLRGWLIGAGSAALVGAALFWVTPLKPSQALALAFIAGGAGTLGAFVLKALKRDAGVHPWGELSAVTGAVGLLDRLAPLCFAAPVFFHSVRWYFDLRV